MKKLTAILLPLLFLVGSAQAVLVYSEDLEGKTPAAGTLDDHLGWIKYETASVGYGPSAGAPPAGLGTNVIVQPASNSIIHKPIGAGLIDNIITIKADMYADTLYNIAGGESGLGIDSAGAWQHPFAVGPGSNPANPGYPNPGSGGWVVSNHMNGGGRVNITDGGAPGVGNRFMGGVGIAVTMQIAINQLTDTIGVDLIDRASGTPLIPTFVLALTATGKANLANCTDIKLMHFDVHSSGLREVDNISVETEVPEPATMMLLGLGGLALLRRRR